MHNEKYNISEKTIKRSKVGCEYIRINEKIP